MKIDPQKTLIYDVVVCGGGFAGVAAAVSAAREGCRVVLVESGGELGGDITKGIVPQILDAEGKGGLVKDLFAFLNARHRTSPRKGPRFDASENNLPGTMVDLEYVKYFLETITLDAGVTVLYHSNVAYAEVEKGRIARILVAGEAETFAVEGKIFIDATGNGALACMSGCRSDFGHPENGCPQPCSTSMLVTGLDDSLPSTDTNADKIALKEKLSAAGIAVSAEWITLVKVPQKGCRLLTFNNQYGVDPLDALSISQATSRARVECIEIVEKMRGVEGFSGMEILSVSSHIGVREGRRIRGLYSLSFEDITEGRRFEDGICTASFSIDVHKISRDDREDHKRGKQAVKYHIPYRCLVAADCNNLLLTGRCISGDFYAHASYRVVGNVIPTGEAAGYAAAICIRENCDPVQVDGCRVRKHMEENEYVI